MRFFNILSSILIALIFLSVVGVGKNLLSMSQIKDRLKKAEGEVLLLENKRSELLLDQEDKESEIYLEKQIRNKLRRVIPGESLVVLPKELLDKSEDDIYKYGVEDKEKVKEMSYYQKWINIFR